MSDNYISISVQELPRIRQRKSEEEGVKQSVSHVDERISVMVVVVVSNVIVIGLHFVSVRQSLPHTEIRME